MKLFIQYMNFLRIFLLFLAFLIVPISSFAIDISQIELNLNKSNSSQSILIIETGTRISILGSITPAAALAFKRALEEDQDVKSVRIDSPGGDVSSAIDIAMMIKDRKLNLIVDGKCFSACASYIFPSGETKTVLPGSFVGIHNISCWHLEKNENKGGDCEEVEKNLKKSSKTQALNEFKQLRQKEQAFFNALSINDELRKSYASYIANRIKNFGTAEIDFKSTDVDCPPIQLWILSKEQLISSGVKGIKDFWFPRTVEEKKTLSYYYKIPQNSVFFGNAEQLTQFCKHASNKWSFPFFFDFFHIGK